MAIYVGNKRYAPYIGDKRRRYMGGAKGLPYDAEVEYIESNGTQRVNLQYYPVPNTTLVVDMRFVDIGNGTKSNMNNAIFGTSDSGAGIFSANFGSGAGQGNTIYVWNDKKYANGGSIRTLVPQYNSDFLNRYTMTLNRYTFTYWGRNLSLTTKTTTNTTTMWFFGNESASNNRWGIRVYSIQISEEDTIIRDIIPVRIGNTGYLYDKTSHTLYANEDTGAFILGPDKT